MESSIPSLEREDAELIMEAKPPVPGTHPTEDSQSKAHDYQFEMKKEQVIDNNADNDMSAIGAIGVGQGNEKSSEELVFSNHLLLEEIFKHSTFDDLKSHRQLNRLWNLEATKAILNRFSIKPINVSSQRLYPSSSGNYKISVSLEEFQFLMEQSRIFPCNSFLIIEAHPLEEALLNFLKAHGSLIKSIVYDPSFADFLDEEWYEAVEANGSPTPREFLQLLADNLPNLEILTLRTCPSSSPIEPSSNAETAKELKKLHTLKISCNISEELLLLLLNRSKNLKHIYLTNRHYSENLQQLSELNGIHLLQNIFITVEGHSLSLYEQVVKQQLRCKKIKLRYSTTNFPEMSEADSRKLGRILSKAFDKFSGTLEILSLEMPLSQVPELKFSTCLNVTRLVVAFRIPIELSINLPPRIPPFPPSFDLGVTFPNLRKVVMDFDYGKDFLLFPDSSIPLLSVKVLKFCIPGTAWNGLSVRLLPKWVARLHLLPIPTEWLEQLCQLFPNVTHVSLGPVLDLDFGLISTFRFLEKLEFTIVVEDNNEDFVRIDSMLTGFSRETVQKIYGKSGGDLNLSSENVEELRVKACITSLEYLTELVIKIIAPDWHSSEFECMDEFIVGSGLDDQNPVLKMVPNVRISHVSRKFCFDMCPKLESNVVLEYEFNSFLMPRA